MDPSSWGGQRPDHALEIAIFLVFLALIIAIGIYQYGRAEQRQQALRALAIRRGWQFRADQDASIGARYGDFSCLQQGSARYAYNLLTGAAPAGPMCGFDYHYETYTTDSKGQQTTNHYQFSAVIVDVGLPLQPLLIRPETFLDRIGEWFGIEDINFESDEFGRAFYVKAADPHWAFDVIHQATMEFLLAAPRFTLQFAGTQIIAFRPSVFEALEFVQALDVIAGIIDRLPEYLLRDLKTKGGAG